MKVKRSASSTKGARIQFPVFTYIDKTLSLDVFILKNDHGYEGEVIELEKEVDEGQFKKSLETLYENKRSASNEVR